jgi:hypothetical protein
VTPRLLAALAACALVACAGVHGRPFDPHLAWPRTDDAGWATVPALGVAPFLDARDPVLRQGYEPSFQLDWLGFAREGIEHTGDAAFARPVAEGVRDDVTATLARSGTFGAVTPVDFDPRDPAAWRDDAPPLVLTVTIEAFEGRQWKSFTVSPLQLGFVRERFGPADGRVSLHVELWSKAERVYEARVSSRDELSEGSAPDAALGALALDSEKLALRLDAHLRSPRDEPPRKLDVVVVDGCDLGEARVRRLVSETSAIFEREAGIVLSGSRVLWTGRPESAGVDALLEDSERFAAPAGGVVLALAPAQQAHQLGLGLGAVRTGLSVPLGSHALALCAAEDEVSVLTAAHELAHLFGAVHVRDRASIMHATAEFDARFFDPLNRRILRALRERDFARPLEHADGARLAEIYREAERSDARVDLHDLDGALRALQSADR